MSDQMVAGSINCSCGQVFYVETVNNSVNCINCGQVHSTENLPKLESPVEEVAFTEEV
jgi:hypothetical protein